MTEKQLRKTVEGFRKGALGGNPPNTLCYFLSTALHGYLRMCGRSTVLEQSEITFDGGENTHVHWYLKMSDGRIIDATASQFNGLSKIIMPEVYIGLLPEWYSVSPF